MARRDEDRMDVEDVQEEAPRLSYKAKLQAGANAPHIAGLGPDLPGLKPQPQQPKGKAEAPPPAADGAGSSAAVSPSRWHVVYPIYLNSGRSIAQGRRIPRAKAVEQPTLQEMVDSCTALKLPVLPEPDKAYPRDYLWSADRGRIRVQLRDSSGRPLNPDIPNKVALMLRLAALIPKHQGRARKEPKDTKKEQGPPEKEKKGKSGRKKK